MDIKEVEKEKLKELKEKSMMLKDEKDFLKTFLKLTVGIPTAKTYERVISIIDSNELNKIFVEFIKDIQFMEEKYFKDILSFDGKVDKGSGRNKGYITEKTNEITAIPAIIERLDLTNVICTWDALNTQKENIRAVISKGGDYCVALKANQGNFYKDVQDYFDEDRLMIIQSGYEGGYQLTREKSHEAVITYEYYQTEKVKWYEEYEKWDGLKSIVLVKKTIEKCDGSKVEEKRHYISRLLLNINTFSNAIRKH